jgi:hypothetical protein
MPSGDEKCCKSSEIISSARKVSRVTSKFFGSRNQSSVKEKCQGWDEKIQEREIIGNQIKNIAGATKLPHAGWKYLVSRRQSFKDVSTFIVFIDRRRWM